MNQEAHVDLKRGCLGHLKSATTTKYTFQEEWAKHQWFARFWIVIREEKCKKGGYQY